MEVHEFPFALYVDEYYPSQEDFLFLTRVELLSSHSLPLASGWARCICGLVMIVNFIAEILMVDCTVSKGENRKTSIKQFPM